MARRIDPIDLVFSIVGNTVKWVLGAALVLGGLYLLSIPYRAALGWLWGVAEYVFEPAPENFGYVLELFFLGWNL